jgi:hypothetical protein
MYAQRCERMIESIDPQLNDRAYVENLYAQGKIEMPRRPKLRWTFLHLDLALYSATHSHRATTATAPVLDSTQNLY